MLHKIRHEGKNKQIQLSRKLTRTISLLLVFVLAAIIVVTYAGLDWINLGYAAVRMFFAEREIEEAYLNGDSNFITLMDNVEREYERNDENYLHCRILGCEINISNQKCDRVNYNRINTACDIKHLGALWQDKGTAHLIRRGVCVKDNGIKSALPDRGKNRVAALLFLLP